MVRVKCHCPYSILKIKFVFLPEFGICMRLTAFTMAISHQVTDPFPSGSFLLCVVRCMNCENHANFFCANAIPSGPAEQALINEKTAPELEETDGSPCILVCSMLTLLDT